MSQKEQISEALLTELQKEIPLMNVVQIKEEMLEWLKQLPLPQSTNIKSWEERIQEYPQNDSDKSIHEGLRIRLSLKLKTSSNKYVISIIESLSPSSRDKYIIAIYAGWKKEEWNLQKQIEETYKGGFDDIIRPKQVIWIQNFESGTLYEALNSCAIAIIGHELCKENIEPKINSIKHPLQTNFTYPDKEDIQE